MLVVGAGVTGLTAAIALARAGRRVDVWEARDRVGGLLAPFRFRGVDCDLGSHRLHPGLFDHPGLTDLGDGLTLHVRRRNGRLVLGRRQVAYPPTAPGLLAGLGPRVALSLAFGYAARRADLGRFVSWDRDRRRAEPDVGFEQFVLDRVGRAAYDGFYRPYAEKLWGLPPAELSQSVAKRRVSTSSPAALLRGRGAGGTYLYPSGGMAALTGHLFDAALAAGVRVHLGRPFDPRRDAGAFERVVYTGPLRRLAPGAPLEHRGTYLVYLALAGELAGGDVETWYLPERRYWFGRVSEPRNYSAALGGRPGERVLCLEIPEGAWGRGVDFTARVDDLMGQLAQAGVLGGGLGPTPRPIEASQVFLRSVYPVYRRGWAVAWDDALAAATATYGNVVPVGRQGLFLHCNVDHCVAMAAQAADHVLTGADPAGWADRARAWRTVRVRD